jgi:glycogen debranching enzyme
LLERHRETVEGCLSWIDHYGDSDGDGFQEYQTRFPVGYENMGWKDSGDSVVYPDGSLVKGPKALCELQGYVYSAWIRMAEVFDALGDGDRAAELRSKAAALFERFNAAFWDDEFGFYAYELDGDKKKVLTVASNAGHCLWSGIVPRKRAKIVVERLMAPDMWSGWGIRTLSTSNPAFNLYIRRPNRTGGSFDPCHRRWRQSSEGSCPQCIRKDVYGSAPRQNPEAGNAGCRRCRAD